MRFTTRGSVCPDRSALERKVKRMGYYWPNALRDTKEFARKCVKCWVFAQVVQCPPGVCKERCQVPAICAMGGCLDGTLLARKRGVKFIVVAVNYFTKWAEAEPLAKNMVKCISTFLWNNVVCRFGIPQSIISYNEK